MTQAQWQEVSKLIAKQMAASTDKDKARESLLKSGLYNSDGSLKAAYGGKRPTPR